MKKLFLNLQNFKRQVAFEHNVQFYESKNLKDWLLLSEFGKMGDTSSIWECPLFHKVSTMDGSEKWVLMISSGHRQAKFVGIQYFVGDFDGTTLILIAQEVKLYLVLFQN